MAFAKQEGGQAGEEETRHTCGGGDAPCWQRRCEAAAVGGSSVKGPRLHGGRSVHLDGSAHTGRVGLAPVHRACSVSRVCCARGATSTRVFPMLLRLIRRVSI